MRRLPRGPAHGRHTPASVPLPSPKTPAGRPAGLGDSGARAAAGQNSGSALFAHTVGRWKVFCLYWQESATGPVPSELLGSGLPPRNAPTLQLACKAPRISVWASASQPHESKTLSLFYSVKSQPAANRAGEGRDQGKPLEHRGWGLAEGPPPASPCSPDPLSLQGSDYGFHHRSWIQRRQSAL